MKVIQHRPPREKPPARSPELVRISARQAVGLRFYLRELWAHRGLVRVLAGRQLKSQHEMNVVGFIWWILEPLSFAGVYFVLVQVIFRSGTPAYPLFLLTALLPYKWLVSGVTGTMGGVRSNAGLIANVYFPRALLPITELTVEMSHFLVGLLIVPFFMLGYGVGPTWNLAWLPVVIATQFLLMLGLALPAVILGVHYRNLPRLTGNLMRLWFYLSPGIWSLERIHRPEILRLVRLNPLTGIFESYRGAILTGRMPTSDLAYSALVGAVLVVFGAWLFVRREPTFGKVV